MKVRKKDILWGYLGTFINLGVNIILLPIVIRFLSDDELGMWYVFTSLGSIVTLMDFGFAPTLSRNIAYIWSGGNGLEKTGKSDKNITNKLDVNLLQNVLTVCRILYLLLALAALILLSTVGSFYINKIATGYSIIHLNTSWYIYAVALFFNLYIGYYSSFLKGVGAVYEYNKANVISKLLQVIFTFVLLMSGAGLIGVSLSYFLNGIINRYLCKIYFFNYQDIRLKLHTSKTKMNMYEFKKMFTIIWHNAYRDGIVSISSYLTTQANTLLSSTFLTLAETGIFSLSLQIISLLANVAMAMNWTYQPSMQQDFLISDNARLKEKMAFCWVIYILIFSCGSVMLLLFGIPVINFIKGSNSLFPFYTGGMCVYIFLLQQHTLFASYISNTNRIPYVRAFAISSVVAIILEVVFFYICPLKEWTLLLIPLLIQMVYNNWRWPSFICGEFHTTLRELFILGWKECKRKILEHP